VSGDPAAAKSVVGKLRAGLVTVNSWGPNTNAPFGGYKKSGNGREYGKYGLADFMEVKTIVGV
jgi:aldehyde dehydrogenase (NAD+)